MLDHLKNNSDNHLVFGFLMLPKNYKTEYDAIMNLIGLIAIFGVLTNATLLWVIIRDPYKQLRTNTAILVGFNTVTNFIISFILSLERILIWSCSTNIFTPQLTIYLGACNANMFFLGSFLHALNCYGTIVIPLRYNRLAPRSPRKTMAFIGLLWLANTCVFMVIPHVISSSRTLVYIEAIITLDCITLALLAVVFVVIYTRIFWTLYKRSLTLHSFHLRRSSQGQQVLKQNNQVAKTLFIHMAYLVIASTPGSVVFMLALHCSRCDAKNVQLAALFVSPLVYSLFLFHPMLWLCRTTNYRQALKKMFHFKSLFHSKDSGHRQSTTARLPDSLNLPVTISPPVDQTMT